MQTQYETAHETRYLSPIPHEVRRQIYRIEEAWKHAIVGFQSEVSNYQNISNQSFGNSSLTTFQQKIEDVVILKNMVIKVIIDHTSVQFNASQRFRMNLKQRRSSMLKDFGQDLFPKSDFLTLTKSCQSCLKKIEAVENKFWNSRDGAENFLSKPPISTFLMKLEEEVREFHLNSDRHQQNMKDCSVFWGHVLGYFKLLSRCYRFVSIPLAAFVQFYKQHRKEGSQWALIVSYVALAVFFIIILLMIVTVSLHVYVNRNGRKHAREFQTSRRPCPLQPSAP